MIPLDEIRDASEAALAKIGNDPERIRELDDDDLTSVALQMKVARPMVERLLATLCGSTDAADAALARTMKYSQGKLVKMVRAAHVAMKTHGNPSVGQIAALVLDVQAGCGAVMVEQERRAAVKAHAMH